MSVRSAGITAIAVGLVLALIAVFADLIGIGGADAFGWKQTVGVIAGAVLAVVGVALVRREPASGEPTAATSEDD